MQSSTITIVVPLAKSGALELFNTQLRGRIEACVGEAYFVDVTPVVDRRAQR